MLLLGIGLWTLRWKTAAAIVSGGAWTLLNLLLLKLLAPVILRQGKRPLLRALFLLLVKFPVLYGFGWFLLSRSGLSPLGIVAGFCLPLLTTTGAALFDRRREAIAPSERWG